MIKNSCAYWKFMFYIFYRKITDPLSMHILMIFNKKYKAKLKKHTLKTKSNTLEEITLDRKNSILSKFDDFQNNPSEQWGFEQPKKCRAIYSE